MKFVFCIFLSILLVVGMTGCQSSTNDVSSDERIVNQPLGELTDTQTWVTIHPLSTYTYLVHIKDVGNKVILPENFYGGYTINAVGENAFGGYKNLDTVIIPDSYEFISMLAFADCDALKRIEIGAGLQAIEVMAFAECNMVEAVTVSEDNPYLYAENNCIIQRTDHKLIQGFPSSKVPSTVTCIGEAALSHFSDVVAFEIPSSVKEIQCGAFGYTGLIEMHIPSSVEILGDAVFGCCDSLERVYIPDSVLTIGECLFNKSNSSQITVYCEAESKPAGWSDDWLKNCDHVTVVWGYKLDKAQ